ncbi:MAG: hypothetical protein RQ757_12615 [Pseudomonadales bacterium]|nr:hypothetical protein [Pseudomonadales bacterium]
MSNDKKLNKREKWAASVSAAMITVIIVYWIVQINGVMEMLELAYG